MRKDCEFRVRSVVRNCTLIVATIVAVACSEGTAPIVPTKYIVTISKNTAVVGDTVVLKAQLVDANDQPVARSGRTLSWAFSGVAAGFISPTSHTDDLGVAWNYFLVGTKADVSNTIYVIDENRLTGTSPPIAVVAGGPGAYIVGIGTTNADAGSTIPVNAQLTDKFGNALAIAGRVVTWSVQAGGGYYYERGARTNRLVAPMHVQRASTTGGTFSSPTSATNSLGLANINFNVGTTINNTYIITAKDDQVSGNSQAITVHAGPIAKFVITASASDPPAGAVVLLTAYPSDAYDNRINNPGIPVTWSVTGGGTLASTVTSTAQDGNATNTLTTAATPGLNYVVTASGGTQTSGTSPTITTVAQVSLSFLANTFGTQSSCGIATDGKVWCWGIQDGGLRGSRPLPGMPIGDQPASALSNSSRHSCGIFSGTVMCWGFDDEGQLGDNSRTDRTTPAPINSALSFTAVSAGSLHTCALATTGDIYCWGLSTSGRLGDGTGFTGLGPIKVAGGITFTAVSAGDSHTCAIATSGDAYCWGSNGQGQLGSGNFAQASTPRLVDGGLKFTAISAGNAHTCGISGGAIYCWGDNSVGELGNGTSAPNDIAPTAVKSAATFVTVAAGGFNTCALASDGKAYCWGDNATGELGDVTFTQSHAAAPIAVTGGFTFTSIAVGGTGTLNDYYYGTYAIGHVCGLTTQGVTYCWGSNSQGELGISTFTAPYATPQKVSGQQ